VLRSSRGDWDGTTEAVLARANTVKLGLLGIAAGLALVAGCADNSGTHPGAIPLASGQSCGSIQQELNGLLGRGVQGKAEAATAGKKLAPAAQADVDRYNTLLSQYLGARCHV
jgi:hypothetical protein